MPSNGAAGTMYYATDARQNGSTSSTPLYIANSSGTPLPVVSLGPSGGLKWYGPDTIDIDTSSVVVNGLAQAITGNKTFNWLQLASGSAPTCTNSTAGLFWYLHPNSEKDSVQVCASDGTTFAWRTIY